MTVSPEPDEMATAKVPAPELAPADQHCPTCAAPLNGDQRYCLNCGHRRAEMRLPFMDMVEADAQAAQTAGRISSAGPLATVSPVERSPLVLLTSLIALLLALGIGVLIGRGSGGESETVAKAPVVNVSGGGAGTAAPVAVTSDWPAGTRGFTVALKSLPATATAAEVAAAKQDAIGKGATEPGALLGGEYPTVDDPGIVIYSGVFTTRKEAGAALKKLTASFPEAKVVEVGDSTDASASGGEETVKRDPEAKSIPKGGDNLSAKEFQKRSKKLPDKVQSEGKPPPKDNKQPGGGSEATEIG